MDIVFIFCTHESAEHTRTTAGDDSCMEMLLCRFYV